MSQHISAKNLRTIAQIADMGKVDELMRAAQAIIEGKSPSVRAHSTAKSRACSRKCVSPKLTSMKQFYSTTSF